MSADYCAECDGDPRRRENVETHKLHMQEPGKLEPKPQALPDDSKEDWLDIPK